MKIWQHEDTGYIARCAEKPGHRWHEVIGYVPESDGGDPTELPMDAERWEAECKTMLPDYLHDELSGVVDALKNEVLK